MTEQNAISTDDKTTNNEEVEVRVEDEAEGSEQSEVEGKEEEPSQKTIPQKQVSKEEKRNAGNVIADLGNEKKAMAAKLVQLAKSNETSRQQVKEMLLQDPQSATYLKTKFGEDYDFILSGKVEEKAQIDVTKIREEERAKAEAEAIKLQMRNNHERTLEEKAKELKFTTEEFELFKSKVELLGGDEQAIKDAAIVVNYAKATAKVGEYTPDGGEAEKPVKREITITKGLSQFSDGQGLEKNQFAKDISRVKSLHKLDSYGKPVMILPKL
jgi:hypothetical protein